MPRLFRLLLFSLVSTCCLGGSIVYVRIHSGVLQQRLKEAPETRVDRLHKLRAMFEKAGCLDHMSEQAVAKHDLPNVICKLPGKEPGTIVVGAAIDFEAQGMDDRTQWPTLILLPLLAESIGPVQHRFSLTFVAFTGHEHGLRGSTEYLRLLTENQRKEIKAMVSLQSLGRTPPVYVLGQEDPLLANWLALSANSLRLRGIPTEITARAVDARLTNGVPQFNSADYLLDGRSFQRAHIPSIALQSAPASMIPEARKAGALPDEVSGTTFDFNVYQQTYNQLCVYLLYLDSNLGTTHALPPNTAVASNQTLPAPSTMPAPTTGADAVAEKQQKTSTPVTAASAAGVSHGADQPGTLPPDVPVFHSESQLVVMDVSVTDPKGLPVKGLQAGDFTLWEEGKLQTVNVFEEHRSTADDTKKSAESTLPAGTFSNRTAASSDAPLSILLFDLLNTPVQDQAYARAQMLQFLKAMPKGKHIALFVLGTNLRVIQGFTDDPKALVQSAEKMIREVPQLLTTDAQQQQDQGFTEQVGRYAQPSIPNGVPPSVAAQMGAALADENNFIGSVAQRTASRTVMEGSLADQRATLTLDALTAIARAVSGYPGRKNMIWLSGSFQIRLRPSENTTLGVASRTSQAATPVADLSNTAHYQEIIQRVSALMAAARLAVFPMDVRGIRTTGVDISVGTDQSVSMVSSGDNDALIRTFKHQSETRFDERSSMLDLANQTGGDLLTGNDVRGAIARGLEEGSNYYTLAYTPAKSADDKSFRKVEIKLNQGSVKLAYRPGYYPVSPQGSVKQSGAHALAAAMQPGIPQSTMLLVTARIQPPDATSKAVRIDYSIEPAGIAFLETPNQGKRAVLDCMIVALDQNGQIAGQVANTVDATLPPKQFEELQRGGLPLHQELVLAPGSYDLRLGVLDRGSQKIGTLGINLAVPASQIATP